MISIAFFLILKRNRVIIHFRIYNMLSKALLLTLTLVFILISFSGSTQENAEKRMIETKDLVENLYDQHLISFELKRNEKKGMVFVDYLSDGTYDYEIALIDRNPIRIIDSEDIFKITLTDTTKNKNVYQNAYDRGINDIQDFDKKTISEFSEIVLSKPAIKLIPTYSFEELKRKVFQLQQLKSTALKN